MTYPDLSTINATEDLSELLIYVNTLTNGWGMPSVLFSFFIIILLGGSFAQIRFRGSIRFDFAFVVASFATFGLAVLMSMKTGLLNPIFLYLSLGLAILGVIWLYLSSES